MATRLKDVAQLTGVSIKTVSNVVNGTGYVSEELREHVQRGIDVLGYQTNAVARSLRSGRSGIIALAVPEISNPYFSALAESLTLAAELVEISVVIYPTRVVTSREQLAAAGLNNGLIDGVVLSPLALGDAQLRNIRSTLPVVLLGEQVTASRFDHVAIDNVDAARQATKHLLETGRTRIGAIGLHDKKDIGTSRDRLKGYRDAYRQAGKRTSRRLEATVTGYHRRAGYDAANALMQAQPDLDGLFCFNDLLAVGAVAAVKKQGVDIPSDVAIVGFDGTEDAEYSQPSLTTIAPDIDFIASAALDLLSRRFTQPDRPPSEVRAPFQLVVRDSSANTSIPSGPK